MIKLEWDSDFFSMEIYRINLEKDYFVPSRRLRLVDELNQHPSASIYVFLPLKNDEKGDNNPLNDQFEFFRNELESISGRNVIGADIKVEFEINPDLLAKPSENISDCSEISVIDTKEPFSISAQQRKAFENLAWRAAHCSRFNLPPFSEDDCKRLYSCWMENSLKGKLADFIIFTGKDNPKSLLTLKFERNVAKIELLAVAADCSGKGIGWSLIRKCGDICSSNGINKLLVPTQMANVEACSFYKKCGFSPRAYTAVYHICDF